MEGAFGAAMALVSLCPKVEQLFLNMDFKSTDKVSNLVKALGDIHPRHLVLSASELFRSNKSVRSVLGKMTECLEQDNGWKLVSQCPSMSSLGPT